MRLEYTAEEIIKLHLMTEWMREECTMEGLIEDFRTEGGEATDIDVHDRNYEVEVRAMKFSDGWIGWWHLHGGGKYSEPTSYPWIENAFFLNLVDEKEVTTMKRIFEYDTKENMASLIK